MTAPRTVTVQTRDRGPLTIPEPAWCTAASHLPTMRHTDINHQGTETIVTVHGPGGPRELLSMTLTQRPYGTSTTGTGAYVAVGLADGQQDEYDVPGLESLAEDLDVAAGRIRYMARRLAAEAASIRARTADTPVTYAVRAAAGDHTDRGGTR